jgi:hypothetical protein
MDSIIQDVFALLSIISVVYIGVILYVRHRRSNRNVLKDVIELYRGVEASTALSSQAAVLLTTYLVYFVFHVDSAAHGTIPCPDMDSLNLFLWVILLSNYFWVSIKIELSFMEHQSLGFCMAVVVWIGFLLTYGIQFGIHQKWLLFLITSFISSVFLGMVMANLVFLLESLPGWIRARQG